jgi:phosphopantothenoylcysteine decarboxylase/phosphopantothenate--cysteine ligase
VRILVTAGPTHEPWDDVRYLANRGTGIMGQAIALAGRRRGHEVVLVSGPTGLADPSGVRTIRVTTAREMLVACVSAFRRADALFMTAAVADWRPARKVPGKIRKAGPPPSIRLVKNPDILAQLGKMSRGRVVVGFALETGPKEEAQASARTKLRKKRADLIVLNHPDSLGRHEAAGVTLITEREAVPIGVIDKRSLAELLVLFAETRRLPGTGRGAGHRPKKA